ncbi:MAG: hypothetical protein FIA92_14470 [Chloroflexi bacterium]|nr:hypothetical protein [Chloroflexota bacterium]
MSSLPINPGPYRIGTRLPDCPDCGAQMQGVQAAAGMIFRCPWVTASRWSSGLIAGVTVVSCDWPMRDRQPDGLPPYRNDG